MTRPAVVLLSGGLDSATTAAIARRDGFEIYGLTFDYGQRHRAEIIAAMEMGEQLGMREHVVMTIDLRVFGGSALTGDLEIPRGRTLEEIGQGIPPTYVPARNTIFLSYALAWAEVMGARDIFIGANCRDGSGYPDCRPSYLNAWERMANLAISHGNISIHAPLIYMDKADIIRTGSALGVDFSLTSSCYEPTDDGACGLCDACTLRRQGFQESGMIDPIRYRL